MAKATKTEQKNAATVIPVDANRPASEIETPISPKKGTQKEELTRLDIINAIQEGYGDKATTDGQKTCLKIIVDYLGQIISAFPECQQKYNIVILNDEGSIVPGDADKIYSAVAKFKNDKPILLVLYSNGGFPGSAYLIGKLCLEYSKDNLVISVPRSAKSAATLLCCAAKEIHMGSLSELGPIDPQIDSMPALGLKNAVLHIAELVKSYPESSEMFAKYLQLSLPLINLGYYERAAESAEQYAEQLLSTHSNILPNDIKDIAHRLVYNYKDHGFVIEKVEAKRIFGDVIKTNSDEYELGNQLYIELDFIRTIAGFFSYNFYYIGSLEASSANFTKKMQARKK